METLFQKITNLVGTSNPEESFRLLLTEHIKEYPSSKIAIVTEKPDTDKSIILVYYDCQTFSLKNLQELQMAYPTMKELILESVNYRLDTELVEFLELVKTLKLFVLITKDKAPDNISDQSAIWKSSLLPATANLHALYFHKQIMVVMDPFNLELSPL